ncbi:MAG: type II 3-dehydroquinate dehydratase [Firmicutes bacterium]|nr:type II 3-dehydroquinate dehydratase [Bacillota bacterium]
MTKILILQGPNLNLTGLREPEIYGRASLGQIHQEIEDLGVQLGFQTSFLQSNHEGVLIDTIQEAMGKYDWIILNPGALSHYSYALRDAVAAAGIPAIEVHLSNIFAREEFRACSVLAPVCAGQIAGFGYRSYLLALYAIFEGLEGKK